MLIKKELVSIPRWVFEMLPNDKIDIAKNCVKEMYLAGFQEGQHRKSKEVQDMISKLQNL